MLSSDFWVDFPSSLRERSELRDWKEMKKIPKRIENMQKVNVDVQIGMSYGLMTDLGWYNELGLFLFSSPSSCLIGVLYSAGATCTSPLAGWVRCFVLNHAAKLLLFSHFCCLTQGQYPPIHPSLSFLKEKCIFGGSNWAEFDKKHQKNAPIPKK